MINTNNRIKDAEDVGVLFHAIIRYVEANENELDESLQSLGYANLLERAEEAAEFIAELHDAEGDAWDGAVWIERLEDIGEQSLAKALIDPDDDLEVVVKNWLVRFE